MKHQDVDRIVGEIRSLVQAQLKKKSLDPGTDLANLSAHERWVANTSIVKVLADALSVSKASVVDDLASRTQGVTREEELRIAICTGIAILGKGFETALLNEVVERLQASE